MKAEEKLLDRMNNYSLWKNKNIKNNSVYMKTAFLTNLYLFLFKENMNSVNFSNTYYPLLFSFEARVASNIFLLLFIQRFI